MPEIISRKEAIEKSLSRYFTGELCKYGHLAERYTKSGLCRTCVKNQNTKSRLTPREEIENRKLARKKDLHIRNTARKLNHTWYFTEFLCSKGHSLRSTSDGRCLDCNLPRARDYKKRNYSRLQDKNKKTSKKFREDPKNKRKINESKQRWKRQNRNKCNANLQAYRTKKKHALPPYADLKAIETFYENCPKGMHVDHVIPLQGKLASGLHVLENLQYLDKKQNASKGNKFTPYVIIGFGTENCVEILIDAYMEITK